MGRNYRSCLIDSLGFEESDVQLPEGSTRKVLSGSTQGLNAL
jgi:hypothetical protein